METGEYFVTSILPQWAAGFRQELINGGLRPVHGLLNCLFPDVAVPLESGSHADWTARVAAPLGGNSPD